MVFTLTGLLLLAIAPTFPLLLLAASLIGMGSAVFHPESSRVARLASGGRLGLAQSVFQVGGNTGSAIGPLLAAFVVLPHGQRGVAWFSLVALAGHRGADAGKPLVQGPLAAFANPAREAYGSATGLSRGRVVSAIAVLIALVFSKYFYLASFTSYYTFYLMTRFHVGVRSSQIHLFAFLGAVAAGTLIGGPIGDRIGRKTVIWCSILGVLPLTLLLPYANLFWTGVLSVIVGLVLASAFPGNPCLRAGTGARKGGNDLRSLLRVCLRHGRYRRGDPGQNCRRNQHSLCVQDMCVSSGDWIVGRVSAFNMLARSWIPELGCSQLV